MTGLRHRLAVLVGAATLMASFAVVATPAIAPSLVFASNQTVTGANTFASLDGSAQDDDLASNGTFTVTGDLTLDFNATITCNDSGVSGASACPITIVVGGDLVMRAGSSIRAENTNDGGNGGDITITVGGDMTMCAAAGAQPGCGGASANPGALISSQKTAGAGDTGVAGDITITVGSLATASGTFYMEGGSTGYGTETGARIDATGTGPSGDITITVGDGYVTEPGSVIQSGGHDASAVQRGGKIYIVAGCDLTTEGRVTSKGPDPGADLVHLEGCAVNVRGLVESTGKSHTVDNSDPDQPNVQPANSCDGFADGLDNEVIHADKPGNATGCIEVWGKVVIIDATNGWAGELNADVGDGGTRGESWIDIYALRSLTVTDGAGNDQSRNNMSATTYFSVYAVHANTIDGSDATPNTVTAMVKEGPLTASGKAFEASASLNDATGHGTTDEFVGNGSTGGTIDLEASGNVSLDGAWVNASGDFVGGTPCPDGQGACGDGGHIVVSAWGTGSDLSWQNGVGDVRPNDSGGNTTGGDISLNACDVLTTTGTDFRGETPSTSNTCDNTKPTLPSYVSAAFAADAATWALCSASRLSGLKWDDQDGEGDRDLGEPGLSGWTIHVTGPSFDQTTATDANGNWSMVVPGGQTYLVCEVLQDGWTQTYPTSGPPCGQGEGPIGYLVDLSSGPCCAPSDAANLDFGNHQEPVFQPPECKEDPNRTLLQTRTVDLGRPEGGSPVNYHSIQAAYAAAADNAGEVIGLYSNTTENLDLGGSKTLTITQCTLAKVTAADNGLPVWRIHSTGKLTIIGPDSVGGTVGWLVETNYQTLKSVRAYNASAYGAWIKSSYNSVSFNSVSGSPVGVRIEGTKNVVKSGTISGNGTGVEIAGTANTLSGNTVGPNTGVGVLVSGNTNTIKGVSALSNGADGFRVTGTGNLFDSNKAYKNVGIGFSVCASATGTKLKSNSSNTGNSGSSNENKSFEYKFAVVITNLGGNKKDSVSFGSSAIGSYE
jgi:hypothetical protein